MTRYHIISCPSLLFALWDPELLTLSPFLLMIMIAVLVVICEINYVISQVSVSGSKKELKRMTVDTFDCHLGPVEFVSVCRPDVRAHF